MKQLQIILVIALSYFSFFTSAQVSNETLGTSAGASITVGDYNVMIGDSAGKRLTTGSENVFLGEEAAPFCTSGSRSVFIGMQAGYSLDDDWDNVIIGYQAGFNVKTYDNVMIGKQAGYSATTGTDNVIIGEEAGWWITGGDDNVIIGEDAGGALGTGDDNTAIGNQAMGSRFSFTAAYPGSYRNTAVGNEALHDVGDRENCHHNTAIGDSAGVDNGGGNYNTYLGAASGAANEYGDYNTFVGAYAGYDNNRTNQSAGVNHNAYVGYRAGYRNREGQFNVVMGSLADFRNNGDSNNPNDNRGNVILGYDARADESYSIVVGHNASAFGTGTLSLGSEIDYSDNNTDYAVGLGYAGFARNATNAVGLGRNVHLNTADNAIAIGAYDTILADYGMAIGYEAKSTAQYGSAYGYQSSVGGVNSMAFGYGSTVPAGILNSVAFGTNATVNASNAFVLGSSTERMRLGIGNNTPNVLAAIDLGDTDRGLLLNRMTTAQVSSFESALSASEEGIAIYDTDNDQLKIWDGSSWTNIGADTDQQDLDLSGNTLSLTNDASTVDLSGYLDNTDAQTLTLTGTSLDISNGNNVDLSVLQDGTGTDNQDLDLSGNALSLTNDASTVDLSGYLDNTDAQTLILTGTNLDISNGNNVDLSVLQDGTGSDDQNLTLVGTDLSIESGNTVDLQSILGPIQAQLDALTARVDSLEAELDACCGGLNINDPNLNDNFSPAILYQNIPNPSTGQTTIRYFLPKWIKNAEISFINSIGQNVKVITLSETGNGHVVLDEGFFVSGTYIYSLVVNGSRVDSKKMIIQ